MKKRFLIGILSALAIILVCVGAYQIPESKYTKLAKQALEQKYGEPFTITMCSAPFLKEYYTVEAYADAYPDLPFEAHPDNDGGNVADEYAARRISRAISDQVEKIAEENGYPCFVDTRIVGAATFIDDADMTWDEYLQRMPNSEVTVRMYFNSNASVYDPYASKEEIEEKIKPLFDAIRADMPTLAGDFKLYTLNAETIDWVKEYVATHTELANDWKTKVSYGDDGFFSI